MPRVLSIGTQSAVLIDIVARSNKVMDGDFMIYAAIKNWRLHVKSNSTC